MFNEEGYNLHLIAVDKGGDLIANLVFPNALDSVCGCFVPPGGYSYFGTSLTTHRTVYGYSENEVPEDMEIWAVASPFHRLQPLLDSAGRPVKVMVPKGAYVFIYSYPKVVRKEGAPSGPINIQVYASQLGTSGPLPAQLYWLDSSYNVSALVYSDGTQSSSRPRVIGVSDVRKGGSWYCRMLVRLDAASNKSISYFVVAPDFNKVAPFKVQFPSPVMPQYYCGSPYPVVVSVDLPRG